MTFLVLRMSYPPDDDVWQYTQTVASPGISPNLPCPEFLLDLHYIGMSDWLPTCLNSLARLTDTKWPKALAVNYMVGLSDMATENGQPLRPPPPKHTTIRCDIDYFPKAESKGQTSLWAWPNFSLPGKGWAPPQTLT